MSESPAGRRAAWRELFTAQYPRLAGWARRLVDDDETAHEIAAEAFTRLMSRWSRVDHPIPYLYKIANNLVKDHWRRLARERRAFTTLASEHREEAVDTADSGSHFRAMLEVLPEHQRSAVLLHYLAGLSIDDVAVALGRPAGTVKSDLYRARTRLRTRLGADG